MILSREWQKGLENERSTEKDQTAAQSGEAGCVGAASLWKVRPVDRRAEGLFKHQAGVLSNAARSF
jgi:hypothetical protein